MIKILKQMIIKKWINRRNEYDGKINIMRNVAFDISEMAHIKVSGKLILGASDWRDDNRNSGVRIGKNGILKVNGKEQIYTGCYISIGEDATLEFGGDGFVNHGCNIDCCQHISIGKGTIIAKQVLIRDSDNHEMMYDGYVKKAPITIGEHCWIGMRACILKGVTIGDGSIVAAGAIVTRSVPANSLVAGIPARVVKKNVIWK